MQYLITLLACLLLSSCTIYQEHITVNVKDGGAFTTGNIEVLADVKKGDLAQNATSDGVNIPLGPGGGIL